MLVRNYAPGEKWLPGAVATRENEVQYGVDLNCGTAKHCHVEEMRKQSVAVENPPEPSTESSVPEPTVIDLEPPSNEDSTQTSVSAIPPTIPKTYPKRDRKSVTRFDPSWN